MKAMSKGPEERFQSVVELMDAFRHALESSRSSGSLVQPAKSWQPSRAEPAVGLYLHVDVAPEELEEPDDGLLDDIEFITPLATAYLTARGYLTAYDHGTAALFVHLGPNDTWRDANARRGEIDAALRLFHTLEHRPTKDSRVQLQLYLHVGEVTVDGDTIEGGMLLDTTDWTPAVALSGVFASSTVLTDLDIETKEISTLVRRIGISSLEPTSRF
jgi:hypothetical protein